VVRLQDRLLLLHHRRRLLNTVALRLRALPYAREAGILLATSHFDTGLTSGGASKKTLGGPP
jgi:hypothetical protein